MNLKSLFFIFFVSLTLFIFVGCTANSPTDSTTTTTNSSNLPIVGTWKYQNTSGTDNTGDIYTFNSDGTFIGKSWTGSIYGNVSTGTYVYDSVNKTLTKTFITLNEVPISDNYLEKEIVSSVGFSGNKMSSWLMVSFGGGNISNLQGTWISKKEIYLKGKSSIAISFFSTITITDSVITMSSVYYSDGNTITNPSKIYNYSKLSVNNNIATFTLSDREMKFYIVDGILSMFDFSTADINVWLKQ
ncbi:MAG: hypothetical protein A2Y34_03025 [Spirochaetes bacterium GWC1_27_15]|nr:MAG: hypothetical protein A2Z98_15615 [Spirochaetes bacterium GWB1_27_13]OHD21998.1 MAG: hypothetical protein A2Y34_03025 [Spirochaetes bacterium GWC1_27_15]